jgi:hypothetical protein
VAYHLKMRRVYPSGSCPVRYPFYNHSAAANIGLREEPEDEEDDDSDEDEDDEDEDDDDVNENSDGYSE